jgi:hypothetical protein
MFEGIEVQDISAMLFAVILLLAIIWLCLCGLCYNNADKENKLDAKISHL